MHILGFWYKSFI